MAAPVVVNELLNFAVFNYKRLPKVTLTNILANFYHEDEMFCAKMLLCDVVNDVTSDEPIEGWAKLVNGKGAPINRKGVDGAHKRSLEADDVITMLAVLDVNDVNLPTYVSANLDRVPGVAMSTSIPAALTSPSSASIDSADSILASIGMISKTLEAVVNRLDNVECKLTSSGVNCASVTHSDIVTSDVMTTAGLDMSNASSTAPVARPAASVNSGMVITALHTHKPATSSNPFAVSGGMSWADKATALANDSHGMQPNPRFRVLGKGSSGVTGVKAVPRRPTCFVGRLDPSVTDECLEQMLKDNGILDVRCKKITPKNGKVYSTAAFRVSCGAAYESLFYDETLWPSGVELRDWVFYNNNGGQ